MDRALHLLLDYQAIYQFAIVKCQARPQMKRSVDIQEDIMSKGIEPIAEPQRHPMSEPYHQDGAGLAGYGQLILQGQI